jgi:superfamily II DNA/RNA helicase
MDFASLGLHSALLGALSRLTHATPTAVQLQAIPAAMAGKDLLVSSHTGSGKTGAFLLPLLHRMASDAGERRPRVLILTPTRELALQIERAARDYTIELRATGRRLRTACLIGGAPFGPQLNALAEGSELLIATPGRMLDHMERGRVDLSGVKTLVLDEADRMLDMGFVEDIDLIAARLPADRQTLLFSATLDGRVAPVARRLTKDPQRIELSERIDRALLTEVVHHADDLDHKNRLLDAVLATNGMDQAIIFMSTKLSTEDQAGRLRDAGHAVAALHGDLPQHARNRVVRMLLEGRIQIVVATDVAARGLDVAQLPVVVNYDLPRSAVDYVHRIGRTGRAGESGLALSFVSAATQAHWRLIEKRQGLSVARAQVPGFEPTEAAPVLAATQSRSATGESTGGVKGKRPSKKDKLRAAAAQPQ